MHRHRLALERLESRNLLSFGAGIVADSESISDPSGTIAALESSTQVGTTVLELITGEILTLGISPRELVGEVDLAGLTYGLDTEDDARDFRVDGVISRGLYEDGIVSLLGPGTLNSAFVTARDPYVATLQAGGALDVWIVQSQFEGADFLDLDAEVDVQINGGTLQLEGAITGKLDQMRALDVQAELALRYDFSFATDGVSATLKAGEDVAADFEVGELVEISLDGLAVDVTVETQQGPLELRGEIDGKYENGAFDYLGSLSLTEDFSYRKGPVTTTLRQGGRVDVAVERSEFQYAELTSVEVEVNIEIGDKDLSLEGTLNEGKYSDDYTLDFLGNLSLTNDFEKQFGDSTATLKRGGSVDVKVEQSDFKYAELISVDVSATVNVEQSPLELDGQVDGKINEDIQIDFGGRVAVSKDFDYRRGRLALRIDAGEDVNLATRADGLLEVGLDGVDLAADIAITRRKTLELEGIIVFGNIVDGMLDVDADLALRRPLVLLRWPVHVAIVSADVALSVDDGEIESFQLRRPVVEVVHWWHPRKGDRIRLENFLASGGGIDLNMGQR